MVTGENMRVTDGIRWLWNTSRGFHGRILLSALCGTIRIGVSLTFVWACKHLVDIATRQTGGDLGVGLLLLVLCIALQLTLSSVNSRIYVHTEITLRNRLRQHLLIHILKSRWTGREMYHTGDMLNRMEGDVDTVTSLVSSSIPSVVTTFIQLIGAAVFLAYLDIRLAAIVVLIMPIALAFSKLYMKKMRKLTREIRTTDSRVQSHLQENLQHRTLISTLECVPMVADTMSSLQTELKQLVMKRNSFSIFSGVMVQAGFATGYITAFAWGVFGLSNGTVTFGMLTAFLQLVAQIQRPVVELSRQLPAFINALTSVERLDELASMPLEEQGDAMTLTGETGIRLEHVSFTYPDGKRKILNDFSHDFPPGSLTAVLGETGSGKSTLVRLLLALLLPDEGNILLYNSDQAIAATPLTRRNFIYVPQGNTLISGTIRRNLQLGNPDATDEEMYEALHTAAADFVKELPEGLDASCGEMGAGLSEGQAQRIAIARGLLRPGNIVLLDEPTSSIDTETEKLLLTRLSQKVHDKTLIIITHQVQTARLCTYTVRLERNSR